MFFFTFLGVVTFGYVLARITLGTRELSGQNYVSTDVLVGHEPSFNERFVLHS